MPHVSWAETEMAHSLIATADAMPCVDCTEVEADVNRY